MVEVQLFLVDRLPFTLLWLSYFIIWHCRLFELSIIYLDFRHTLPRTRTFKTRLIHLSHSISIDILHICIICRWLDRLALFDLAMLHLVANLRRHDRVIVVKVIS